MLAQTLVNGDSGPSLGAAWPAGVPMGPPTPRKPNGERLWICKDYAHLGPGRACVAMYGGPEPGHPEYPNVLGEIKALQRAINGYIDKFKIKTPKIIVDGTVGPKTLAAYREIWKHANGKLPALGMNTVDDLTILTWQQKLFQTIANLAGIPVDTSIIKRSTDERGAPAVTEEQSGPRASGPGPGKEPSEFPHWAWWLIGGAAFVGVTALGYSLYRKRRPRKKKRRVVRVRPHVRVV